MVPAEKELLLKLLSGWYFTAGIEYGLYFSSIYSRLVDDLGAQQSLFAYVIAVFPLAGALLATFIGKHTDKRGSIDLTIIFGLFSSILGNLIYCFASSGLFVILARFVGGIGNAIDGAIMGFAGRIVHPDDRGATFARLLVAKQVGTISCPAWVAISKKLIKPILFKNVSINVIFACIITLMWLLVLLGAFYVFFVRKLASKPSEAVSAALETTASVEPDPSSNLVDETTTPAIEDAASKILPNYINEPFVVANMAVFSSIFLQASNETLVTPFNKSYFGWGTSQNALEFMMIGFCALIGYMFAKYLMATLESRPRVDPKKVFGAGVGGCVFVCFFTAVVLALASFRATWVYTCIALSILIFCITFPLSLVSSASIIAKNTPEEYQSFTQSIRVASEKIAQVLAPLWVGGLLPAETNGLKGVLIMAPSIFFFIFTSSALCSVWQYL
ncbi:Oidioi.mRNA.OKI2018_I69.XSR.g15928.t1.cds [Oikopleura dioica]|uniref:Oidioi.mRNA.OKI2018_I69.XSR.g15928.t1.cds n=1 Tax=Oikopleura dioica TaxID=34765 RepID=A0ABN7SIN1_OIKDI|nr:Oidioi.mRNA.OKI2018_I69.XSR.g15928.t1.cds [Oikopleura dioica]